MNDRRLVKIRHSSRPSGNVSTHKATARNILDCYCSCGQRFAAAAAAAAARAAAAAAAAAVAPRLAYYATKDCATTRPHGKAVVILDRWYPRGTT